MWRRSRVIAANEIALMLADPGLFVFLLAMPLVLIGFVQPVFEPLVRAGSASGSTGAAQAVPGVATVFAFFAIGHVGLMFHREHAWGTWTRLRAATGTAAEIIIGKAVPIGALVLGQQLVLFAGAVLLFDLDVRSPVGVLAVAAVLSLALLAFGIALASVFDRIEHFSAAQSVGTLVLGGFGGALTPIDLLPGWVAAIGRLTPVHWAVQGYLAAIDGEDLSRIVPNLAAILAFAALCGAVAMASFRAEEEKQFWA